MPHGTLFHFLVRRPFAGWLNQWHHPQGRYFLYTLTGSAVLVSWAAKDHPSVSHEEHYKTSNFYRLNLRDIYENPIYAIPPLEDGTHGEVTGVAAATNTGHGHGQVKVHGPH